MSITQTFITGGCCECNCNHTYIWICVIILLSGIFLLIATWMVLKHLKNKQTREEELERDILAANITKDSATSQKNV